MNRRVINETAFWKACETLGTFGNGLGEEELRQRFEECFETCRRGLEADCLRADKLQQNLSPLEEKHVRSKAI